MFDGKDLNMAMGVPFYYGVVESVAVGVYVIGACKACWTKAPAHAPIWNVMWTSYEVLYQQAHEKGETVVDGIEINLTESSSEHPPPSEDVQEGNILTTFIWWDNRNETPVQPGTANQSRTNSSTRQPSPVSKSMATICILACLSTTTAFVLQG